MYSENVDWIQNGKAILNVKGSTQRLIIGPVYSGHKDGENLCKIYPNVNIVVTLVTLIN